MPFFHLRTPPGDTGPGLPHAYRQIWSTYLSLDRSQWLDPAEIERRQLEQARSLLAHCNAHVPYYRQLLQTAGIVADAVQTMESISSTPLW